MFCLASSHISAKQNIVVEAKFLKESVMLIDQRYVVAPRVIFPSLLDFNCREA